MKLPPALARPRKNPLLVFSTAAVIGVLLADWWAFSKSWPLWSLTAFTWLLFGLKPALWRAFPAVLVTFMLLHTQRRAETYDHPIREFLMARSAERGGQEATVRGTLLPWTKGAELDPTAARCDVSAIRWDLKGEFLPLRGCLKVQLPRGWTLEQAGQYEIQGRLSLPLPAMNPGQFDPADYGLRNGWIAILKTRKVSLLASNGMHMKFHMLQAAERCRRWIEKQLSFGIQNEGPHAGVILAMALGASDAAGDDIEEAFRRSGTLHVFAVSGLHVVLLGQLAFWGLRGFGTRRSLIVVITLVFLYAFITGWRPSAARAALMASTIHLATLLSRQPRLLNSLGAAALLLLALDSHQLFMPGFQLSFGVLLAIAVGASWLVERSKFWYEADPFIPAVLLTRWQRLRIHGGRQVTSLMCVSATAWLGSLPLMIHHFQTITPVALISNLILVPASSFCLGLCCVSLLLAVFHLNWAVALINHWNAGLAKAMVFLVTWFADLPMASQSVTGRFSFDASPAELRVLHLSGGGGASYLRSGKRRWLLDTGNERSWRYIVSPFLRSEGVNRLDGLILSHSDIAHVGATSVAMEALHVRDLHTSVLEPWRYDPPFASLKKLSQTVVPDGPMWHRHAINEKILLHPHSVMPVSAQVLHPSSQDLFEKADDRGLVLMLCIGPWRVLWLNDAGFNTEKLLLERGASLKCDVLVRNQHRADFSGLPELILAADPQAVISSNDSLITEERLPARLREFCLQHEIPLLDMEATGSVQMTFRHDCLRLGSFRGDLDLTLQCPSVPPP